MLESYLWTIYVYHYVDSSILVLNCVNICMCKHTVHTGNLNTMQDSCLHSHLKMSHVNEFK